MTLVHHQSRVHSLIRTGGSISTRTMGPPHTIPEIKVNIARVVASFRYAHHIRAALNCKQLFDARM